MTISSSPTAQRFVFQQQASFQVLEDFENLKVYEEKEKQRKKEKAPDVGRRTYIVIGGIESIRDILDIGNWNFFFETNLFEYSKSIDC